MGLLIFLSSVKCCGVEKYDSWGSANVLFKKMSIYIFVLTFACEKNTSVASRPGIIYNTRNTLYVSLYNQPWFVLRFCDIWRVLIQTRNKPNFFQALTRQYLRRRLEYNVAWFFVKVVKPCCAMSTTLAAIPLYKTFALEMLLRSFSSQRLLILEQEVFDSFILPRSSLWHISILSSVFIFTSFYLCKSQ